MDIVVGLAFVAVVVFAADRLMLSLRRRGYVYWRRGRRTDREVAPAGAGAGVGTRTRTAGGTGAGGGGADETTVLPRAIAPEPAGRAPAADTATMSLADLGDLLPDGDDVRRS
jgi:hypothetical protein